ncbi:hypothetical protein AB4Y85_15985 [Microvirga sp. 2YAF29]|uniref:hypothetical protein n=1 Tax=Microvirga sp. 2YAF29 TaxID=3233031 RepID=UPI003F9A61DD
MTIERPDPALLDESPDDHEVIWVTAPASPLSPDLHPPQSKAQALLRKILMWSVPALLIILVPSCVVSFSPNLKRRMFGPDFLASVTLEPERATVSVELMVKDPFGKVEYERSLIVAAPDGSRVTADLTQDHGGFSAANLYRTKDGKLVLADTFDAELVSLSPLRIDQYGENYLGNRAKLKAGLTRPRDRQHYSGLLESAYFDGLFYVGTFRFQEAHEASGKQTRIWSFVPASEQDEVIKDLHG